ncbi:MAG: acetolactate synthase small subunit, partial [Euryarchaeota archaeon]|nr:acetolactate synthase small subunit [Euryarchaeota archaeon]
NKLVDVIKVRDLEMESTVKRELCLIKVHAPQEKVRSEVIQYASIFRGRIIDVSPETLTVEITGDPEKIQALIDLLKNFGIKELARTGPTAISRGTKTI